MMSKVVLALRADLPAGMAANAAVVLGLSLGPQLADWIGADGHDASGELHPGLNTHPVPVVAATAEQLRELRLRVQDESEVRAIALSEVARRAREYGAYLEALEATKPEDIDYVGVIVHGARNRVTRLTKKLPLL